MIMSTKKPEEPRDLLLEASLALSVLCSEAKEIGLDKETRVLCDLIDLLQSASHMEATNAYGLRCQFCGHIMVDTLADRPSLLRLLHLIQTHTCPKMRKEHSMTAATRARSALDAACEALSQECSDPARVWTLVDTTLRYVHEVVRDERDRFVASPGNDPDTAAALGRVVDLTEPERLRRG